FNVDHIICGDTYRCIWAIREYPPQTTEQAILCRFGDKENVTVHIYSRFVDNMEQRRILQNATRKNKMQSTSEDVQESITAEGNMEDVVTLLSEMRKNKEPLLHCAVFLELCATSYEKLKELQSEVAMELTREKLTIDRLTLRQKEGFLTVMPCGSNNFGSQFERVLPASSVANLYPFNYSGKTDPHGFYIGKDRYGTNILLDVDRRADDKTNSNILILGNSGQGKSYLMKLLLTNLREAGKSIIILDAEQEYEDLTNNLGGCYIDLMSGRYIINPLEPKAWADDFSEDDDAPEAFRKSTRLSQHISYLKDFFRSYKDFADEHIDAIEILLSTLYTKYGITDYTDYNRLSSTDYPIMSDLYDLVECEYLKYEQGSKSLFTEQLLREICLGLNSMCKGAESKFFCGHTNISDDKFICFGVKGLMDSNKKLKDAMLFNILSYMNHKLLTCGNTVASIDELYLFLTNLTAIEYIRNASKRVRKKESAIILASQNIEDFLIDGIREYTKPLFSIPTHQFLFNAGNINPREYMDALQIEKSEFDLIKFPERGVCLFKCGNERYLLQVIAPEYKAALFGKAGGR
ncbi:MAG: VirB4 family type IV secretion system protein, partial [Clostridia bacterium]|nr:VirB4 family type IV secretion system protein [Clostridia bacterium]